MNILGVITARKGSKRLPGKNMMKIGGKTLIRISAEFGKKLLDQDLIDDLIISTDCSVMMEEALNYGDAVTIIRPDHLAIDTALHVDVLRHAIYESEKLFMHKYDVVIILQPTNPFRCVSSFMIAIDKMEDLICDSVVSYFELNLPLEYLAIMKKTDIAISLIGNKFEPPEQKNVYCRSGNIVLVKRNAIVDGNCLGEYNRRSIIIGGLESVNVDTEADYHHAVYLHNKYMRKVQIIEGDIYE